MKVVVFQTEHLKDAFVKETFMDLYVNLKCLIQLIFLNQQFSLKN